MTTPTPRMRAVCPHLARSPQEPATRVVITGEDLFPGTDIRGPFEIALCRECGDLVARDLPDGGGEDGDAVLEIVRRLYQVWPEVFG